MPASKWPTRCPPTQKKLANVAAGPDLNKFDASLRSVADGLAGFDTTSLNSLGFPKNITVTTNQAEAAAQIVQDFGHLLLEQAVKSQLKKFIAANSGKVDKFTALLAEDIGADVHEGMRDVLHRSILFRLQQVAGDTDEWKKGAKEREALVDSSIALAAQMQSQDDSLAALRDACLQFAVAHRQLLQVVETSESFSADRSIQTSKASPMTPSVSPTKSNKPNLESTLTLLCPTTSTSPLTSFAP